MKIVKKSMHIGSGAAFKGYKLIYQETPNGPPCLLKISKKVAEVLTAYGLFIEG